MTLDACLQRQDIWRGKKTSYAGNAIATGFAALDHCLPGKGWPRGALTEILVENIIRSPLWLILPALKHVLASRPWQVWIAPPALPYPPGLIYSGLDVSKIIVVEAENDADILWSAEQSLRSNACSAVIFWSGSLKTASMRRLQLAAESGDTWGVCFQSDKALRQHSLATLRIRCRETLAGLKIDFLKCRGGPLYQDISVTSEFSKLNVLNTGDEAGSLESLP
ncbi:MAG: translesion DNA synthesis-associated protein ImuA [Gammaproteobacteria bacterium]|nr:translesion DNA synthesis-associated protein ImuA [Gammaproteobacteria bacterium]